MSTWGVDPYLQLEPWAGGGSVGQVFPVGAALMFRLFLWKTSSLSHNSFGPLTYCDLPSVA